MVKTDGAEENEDSGGRIIVLFGSQTGTAEDVAERIGRECRKRTLRVLVTSMDDFPIHQLPNESMVIFVCSTTGQGEEPDNMKNSWRFFLRKSLAPDSLDGVRFAVLGLGDSSYQRYNFVAKKLYRRLQQLGGHPLMDLGLADDQHDLGADFAVDAWMTTLRNHLGGSEPPQEFVLKPRYRVITLDAGHETQGPVSKNAFRATLASNKRLTPQEHFQDVRLVKFNVAQSGLGKHEPGDVLMVHPCNLQENVEEFFKLFHFDADTVFRLTSEDSDVTIPAFLAGPVTLRHCVEKYFDLQAVPRRSFFEIMSHLAKDETEKEKLVELSSTSGQQDLFDYCNRPRRSVLEVLADFRHTRAEITFEYLFDLFTVIKPRAFSIASSRTVFPDEVHLLIAVVSYKTMLVKPRLGLCSNWLLRLPAGSSVDVWIRKGSLRFPDDPKVPVIMIGPGTGCAPFHSFLQERVAGQIGGNFLFFGCRNSEMDFFFKDVWNEWVRKGLLRLSTAFSRDQNHKIYVQHRLQEDSKLIWDLMHHSSALFMVAGNAKQMPDEVVAVLKRCATEQLQLTEDEADAYIKKLELSRRLQMETWS